MTVNGNHNTPLFAGCLVAWRWAFDCYFLYNAQNLYDNPKPVFAPPYPFSYRPPPPLALMGTASCRVAVQARAAASRCLVLRGASGHVLCMAGHFRIRESRPCALLQCCSRSLYCFGMLYSFVRVDAAAATFCSRLRVLVLCHRCQLRHSAVPECRRSIRRRLQRTA